MRNQRSVSTTGSLLIVDDTLANLRLLSRMLAQRGYKARAVTSGPQALNAVRAHPPDLILLDILMPEMDGYEVCRRLKEDERTRDIPILFISALNTIEDKVNAFLAGGVDYITKPFQLEEVVARVETHLRLRNLQKQLQAKNAQLEAQNAELDAFAHTVAHDLKTPITSLVGYSELLHKRHAEMPEENLVQCLNTIAANGRKMTNIIDELLLLVSVRKRDEVQMEPLDMAAIVTEVQTRLEDLIAAHRAEIVPPASWPVAMGHGPWVEEVWANYLSNAIKYGGQPPRVEVGAIAQGDGIVRFWVRDNGPGLTPERQARLFVPFERLEQARVEGHGLGLSIVQRIVAKLGGQVGVESDGVSGQGCTFYFTLARAQG